MEILYKRQSQSLIPWSLKVNIWYDLLFSKQLEPSKESFGITLLWMLAAFGSVFCEDDPTLFQ